MRGEKEKDMFDRARIWASQEQKLCKQGNRDKQATCIFKGEHGFEEQANSLSF